LITNIAAAIDTVAALITGPVADARAVADDCATDANRDLPAGETASAWRIAGAIAGATVKAEADVVAVAGAVTDRAVARSQASGPLQELSPMTTFGPRLSQAPAGKQELAPMIGAACAGRKCEAERRHKR
jgi:hypothetical protein